MLSSTSNKQKELIFQFLGGSFHQDIDSPEDALQELLTEESDDYLKYAITFLSDFIENDDLNSEKNEYIEWCADGIKFLYLGLEPLQWLTQVVRQIKETLKAK